MAKPRKIRRLADNGASWQTRPVQSAGMAELVYALALGASGVIHGSSNLPPSTLYGTPLTFIPF